MTGKKVIWSPEKFNITHASIKRIQNKEDSLEVLAHKQIYKLIGITEF